MAKNKQNNLKVSDGSVDGQKKMCEILVKGFDEHGKGYIFGAVAFNLANFMDKFEKSVSVELLKPIHIGSKIEFKISISDPKDVNSGRTVSQAATVPELTVSVS